MINEVKGYEVIIGEVDYDSLDVVGLERTIVYEFNKDEDKEATEVASLLKEAQKYIHNDNQVKLIRIVVGTVEEEIEIGD